MTTSSSLFSTGFETPSLSIKPHWKITFAAPAEDVDRIFEAITGVAELVHGKTDRNAYLHAGGYEYYRPLEGTPPAPKPIPASGLACITCRS